MPLPRTAHGRVLGRLPAKTTPTRTFSDYVTVALPQAPLELRVPAVANWGVDFNDRAGDCTIATAAHAIAAWNLDVNEHDTVPNAAACFAQYSALTGCKTPGDANDTGLVISDLLATWTSTGLFSGNKIAAYAPVAITSETEIKQCIADYGICYVGLNLPASAETQFENGEPWHNVGDQPIGGHCVPFVAYGPSHYDAISWGARIKVAPSWWSVYGEEAWALIPQSFVEAGKGPLVNLAELRADITTLDQ